MDDALPGALDDVDADDYAETAAGDEPAVPRTFQSEEDYQRQRAGYIAKVDDGDHLAHLLSAVPRLEKDYSADATVAATAVAPTASSEETLMPAVDAEKVKLGKREFTLLGYAAGEMYFLRQYRELLGLCGKVREHCIMEKRVADAVDRWDCKCREKLERGGAGEPTDVV